MIKPVGLGLALAVAAVAAGSPAIGLEPPPPWAYVLNPPGFQPPPDDGRTRHVPDSAAAFTLTQARDLFLAPDWHPSDHPPMPDVVAHGRTLQPRPNISVVETTSVPRTFVAGWHLAAVRSGDREPLGRRIVEVPEDLARFESRDARARFTAYVPRGSVEKGRALAATGGTAGRCSAVPATAPR